MSSSTSTTTNRRLSRDSADAGTADGAEATAAAAAPSPLALRPLYGGDHAGLLATFSSATGELIRVPEHLVPESLIEWGQVPSCLEVLTSEDLIAPEGEKEGEEGATTLVLERRTVTVVPEVGCGVDNLDTMRSSEVARLGGGEEEDAGTASSFADGAAVALDLPLPPLRDRPRRRVETSFALPPATETSDDGGGDDDAETYPRRVRVSFDLLPSTRGISSPIAVVLERRTSAESSRGTVGLGGGLDGRTVTRLVGSDAMNRPFAEEEPPTPTSAWEEGGEELRTLSLPGGVVVRYGTAAPESSGPWVVDVVLLSRDDDADDVDGGGAASVACSVVRRYFDSDGEHGDGGGVRTEHWMEERQAG